MKFKQALALLFVVCFGLSSAVIQAAPLQAPVPAGKGNSSSFAAYKTKRTNQKLASKYRSTLLNRFLKYTTYDSQSSETEPITQEQIETAQKLYEEIKTFGFETILTENYYIYVEIPSNLPWKTPVLGFSCHYDTTPDIIGKGIKAQKIEKYDGKPIELKNGHVIDFKSDPYLENMVGKTIVTSDGTTMLSADDKAGVSILVTTIEALAKNPTKPHGKIQVVITPNEDVGRSAEHIEETPYNPDIAFDFDGGVNGEVVVENFNASKAIYTVYGVPGHQSRAAENGYRNAWLPACTFATKACVKEMLPNYSTGREGYVELHHMNSNEGNVSQAQLDFRLRNFSQKEIDYWVQEADKVAGKVAKDFDVRIEREIIKQYGNVGENIHPQAYALIGNAMLKSGITPHFVAERAGTTSAMLMLKLGRGAYTVFTGQNNPHAFTEWLSEEDMFKAYMVALNIIDEVAQIREK